MNTVYAPDLPTFAALVAEFQSLGLRFTAKINDDDGEPVYFIDITGY